MQEQREGQRLQVFLAHCGVASRRACERLIQEGHVTVNGLCVTVPGSKVQPGDRVFVDGAPVKPEAALRYIVLNKPPRFLCAQNDPECRPLARDLLPRGITERLYNVGRLDFLSSGLLIFTNDGDFAAFLGHPSCCIEKEYLVETSGMIPEALIEQFTLGITVEGVFYRAGKVQKQGARSVLISLVEGKNREIRRVFSHFHLHPHSLRRIRIGPLRLGDLREGCSRSITEDELSVLYPARIPPS